jgi:hypothetical protein
MAATSILATATMAIVRSLDSPPSRWRSDAMGRDRCYANKEIRGVVDHILARGRHIWAARAAVALAQLVVVGRRDRSARRPGCTGGPSCARRRATLNWMPAERRTGERSAPAAQAKGTRQQHRPGAGLPATLALSSAAVRAHARRQPRIRG